MNRILLLIIFFLSSIVVLCQSAPQREYYENGKVKSEINYANGVREGEAKFYYENGSLKEERLYVNGRIDGLVRYYNDAGKLIEMANLENGKREGPTSIFDSNGVYITDIFYEQGRKVVETHPYYEQVAVSKPKVVKEKTSGEVKKEPVKNVKKVNKTDESLPPEIEEFEQAASPEYYTEVEVMPEPIGGMVTIQRRLYYPPEAKANAVQGIVKIVALIDENGIVQEAVIAEGIGYGCDDSARITVYYTKFKPGLQRGKPVKVRTIIPVEFKIM